MSNPTFCTGIAEWKEATEVSNDGPSLGGHALSIARKNGGNHESQSSLTRKYPGFPKMAKRTSRKRKILKKNYTLELFDFKLRHRIKLCPERNLDTVGKYFKLGKQVA